MTSYIDELSALLVPFGDDAGKVGDVIDWVVVESAYGTAFPDDYKEFVRRFGNGTIEGMIATLIPIATSDSMVRRVAPLPDSVRADPDFDRWVEQCNEASNARELDRILVWGETDSADVLGWIVSGPDPGAWPIAVYTRGDAAWAVYRCGMVEFLLKLLTAGFAECPISDTSLVGMSHPRFLHDRGEELLAERGIYPWEED
jgi:hypothetical protein